MNLKRALNKMSSIIVNGYLYKKCDYSNNDEIIFFISDSGEKYTCISKGSKKITSKNSRNLIIGSYTEFDFFQARNINKVSLLKKAFILVNID
jgi:DNA repair protein RecO (recombination protein O)